MTTEQATVAPAAASGNNATSSVGLSENPPQTVSGDMSSEAAEMTTFVIECVLYPLFTVFGSAGNLVSIVVLYYEKSRTPTKVPLVALAVSDTLFLVSTMARKVSCIIRLSDPTFALRYYLFTLGPVLMLNVTFSRISAGLVVLITLERCVAVMFPLKVKLYFSWSRMVFWTSVVTVITVLFIFPSYLLYEALDMVDPRTNATVPVVRKTKLYKDNLDFFEAYGKEVLVILFRYFPAIFLFLMNNLIIFKLRHLAKWRKRAIQQQNREAEQAAGQEAAITRTLLTISLLFFIALIPGNIFTLVTRTVEGFQVQGRYHNLFVATSAISHLMEVINSSVNFVIYMALNNSFLITFKQIFCGWRKSAKESTATKSTDVPVTG